MNRQGLVLLRTRPPRFTPAIAAESFVEVQAHLVTIARALQSADAAMRAIDAEAKRAAGWAAICADGEDGPGHGAAA
jgi:hypothetical protein